MKWILILAITLTAFASCGTNREINTRSEIQTVGYEPTYLKDRRLEEYSKLRTNSHGSAWPGNGGSYASGSYRQSALEAKNDTISDIINQSLQNPGRDDLKADTADEGRLW